MTTFSLRRKLIETKYKQLKWNWQTIDGIQLKGQLGCTWCQKVYQCRNSKKVLTTIMFASDLGNDLLSLMGEMGKEDVHYMATHHPQTNETCVFAHYLLSIAIKNMNVDPIHKKKKEENHELKEIAFSRGLFPALALREVIAEYIVTGDHKELYENVIANNLVSPLLLIHRNTSTDILLRFIYAYHKMRQRYYRLSPIDDNGLLNITGFCYDSENNLKISGDHKGIYIFFPKKCQRKPSPGLPNGGKRKRKKKRRNSS